MRNPLNPFEVRYQYSASATQTTAPSGTMALATPEAPAPLSSGVLALYSDGKLECAVNVGSGIEGSECPVTYQALGEHRVTTLYTSGEQSATETEVEHIGPLATTTTLSVSYEALTTPTETEPSSALWLIGTLRVSAAATPTAVEPHLGCGEGASGQITASDCYQLTIGASQNVYANETGPCTAPVMGSISIGETPSTRGTRMEPENLELGTYHLRAAVTASGGYAASEATAPIQFKPEVTFAPDC